MPTAPGNLFPDDASRALLGRATQGDSNAVELLLQQHLPGLRAYIRLKAGAKLLARALSELAERMEQ